MTTLKKLSLIATFIIATAPSIAFCHTASDLDKAALSFGLKGLSATAGGIVTAIGIDKVCMAKKVEYEIVKSSLKNRGIALIAAGTAMTLPLATIIAANAYNYSQEPSELKHPRKELIEEPKDTPKDQTA